MFSKACEYAVRCTIYIASQSQQGLRTDIKEIAKKIDSPEAFTAKILQKLVREGLVTSVKGHGGGFEMTGNQINEITVFHIVKAIDNDGSVTGCFMGLKHCSETHPCPMHERYKQVRNDFKQLLQDTKIQELLSGLKSGESFLMV